MTQNQNNTQAYSEEEVNDFFHHLPCPRCCTKRKGSSERKDLIKERLI